VHGRHVPVIAHGQLLRRSWDDLGREAHLTDPDPAEMRRRGDGLGTLASKAWGMAKMLENDGKWWKMVENDGQCLRKW